MSEEIAYFGGCLFALWVISGIISAISGDMTILIIAAGTTAIGCMVAFGFFCAWLARRFK